MSLGKIDTIMSKNVIALSPKEGLLSAIEKMNFNKVSCIVVIKEKKAVGIITERDIIRFIASNVNFENVKLISVMNSPVIVISEHTDISEAAYIMVMNGVRRLAVVDDDKNIRGIVTQTDIIKNLRFESFISSKKLSQIMKRNVISAKRGEPLLIAIEYMIKNGIGSILIIEENKPLGIITERDITKAVTENRVSYNVENIMTSPVITVNKDMNVYDATRLMDEHNISRLVVINKKGNVIGIVTKSDILRNLKGDYVDLLKSMLEEKSKALVESEVKYRTLVEQSLEGIMIIQEAIIRFVNTKLLEVLDYRERDMIDKEILRFLYPDDRELLSDYLNKLLNKQPVKSPLQIRMLHKKGEGIYMEMLSTLILYESKPAILINLRDISERKRTEAELKRLIITDDLTGLYNQRYFYIQITKEIERAKRHNRSLSIMLIDIDLFKDFNDTYGHWEGDYVLKKIGEILVKNIRDTDMAFRYGGEEFVVILPETQYEKAMIVAERIRKVVEETIFYPFTLEGHPDITNRTVSIGVTEFYKDDNLKSFLRRVDNAMYKAKKNGRNRVEYLLE